MKSLFISMSKHKTKNNLRVTGHHSLGSLLGFTKIKSLRSQISYHISNLLSSTSWANYRISLIWCLSITAANTATHSQKPHLVEPKMEKMSINTLKCSKNDKLSMVPYQHDIVSYKSCKWMKKKWQQKILVCCWLSNNNHTITIQPALEFLVGSVPFAKIN